MGASQAGHRPSRGGPRKDSGRRCWAVVEPTVSNDAIEAIRKHLEGIIAPTMDTRIDVEIEIHLRCSTCGGDMSVPNPRGAAELRCWWCHKAAQKAQKGVPA